MCYFIYGFVNEAGYDDNFIAISKKYGLAQRKPWKPNDLTLPPTLKNSVSFLLTNDHCDCDSPVGMDHFLKPRTTIEMSRNGRRVTVSYAEWADQKLTNIVDWLQALKACKSIKYIALVKLWEGGGQRPPVAVMVESFIDDVDQAYLKAMADDTLYKFNFYEPQATQATMMNNAYESTL